LYINFPTPIFTNARLLLFFHPFGSWKKTQLTSSIAHNIRNESLFSSLVFIFTHSSANKTNITMKYSSTILLALATSAASAMDISSPQVMAKVIRGARRVENNNDNQDGDNNNDNGDDDYLMKYTLKMISCASDEQVVGEDGAYEYGAILFRLCPTASGCSDDSAKGCAAGYGDFIVGLNTYVDSYFEDQRDNMNWDDAFKVDEYAECSEYEGEDGSSVYIGPTCTSDATGVRLAVFDEYTCQTESTTSFETISGGWTLPYSTGGMVSTSCIDCYGQNDDGEYELREMCQDLYDAAAYKCESNMEYFSYYGQNVQGCDYTSSLMPKKSKKSGSSGGKVFGWFVFILVVGGGVGYVMWWRKSKFEERDALRNSRSFESETRRLPWWRRVFARMFGRSTLHYSSLSFQKESLTPVSHLFSPLSCAVLQRRTLVLPMVSWPKQAFIHKSLYSPERDDDERNEPPKIFTSTLLFSIHYILSLFECCFPKNVELISM
jgi:hypothetical protein